MLPRKKGSPSLPAGVPPGGKITACPNIIDLLVLTKKGKEEKGGVALKKFAFARGKRFQKGLLGKKETADGRPDAAWRACAFRKSV